MKRHAVIPDNWTLQIDIDSKRAWKYFKNRINFFQARIRTYDGFHGWKLRIKTTRSTNGNRHVTIKSTMRLTICERICAQLLLGDDPNRGMYNFFRYLNESRFPVLFFERESGRSDSPSAALPGPAGSPRERGSVKSRAKAKAARENGKLGGRPKKGKP